MTGDGRSERAPARLLEAAIEASKGGRRAEAEALCREILTLQPSSLPATHLLAILAAQAGRHETAIGLLREVVARMPQSAEALNQLAALLRLEGQAAEAVSLSRRAASLRPVDPATLENAGLACLADGRFSEGRGGSPARLRSTPDRPTPSITMALPWSWRGAAAKQSWHSGRQARSPPRPSIFGSLSPPA